MQTLIPINVPVGDRTYRIKITPEDEEQVRKTIKTINEKIIEYKTEFAGKDMQDYISMVVLWYATQLQSGSSSMLEKDFEEALSKMEGQLNKALGL
ncbi:MAG: cell division protein ZapA [Sphingobacteriales bacterium]|nr:cell division protein ZapA [Sphingobacteriales bacterium]OJY84442.1 MAG: cell division protein ZapA [Sphingobacteriales bacterium 44-15]